VSNAAAGYELVGKIDDVLVEPNGRLLPPDYKSSGTPPGEDKQKSIGISSPHTASCSHRTGTRYRIVHLFHYYPKDKNSSSLDVTFEGKPDLVQIDIKVIQKKLEEMVALLNGPFPRHNDVCDDCSFYDGRHQW
jgi:hypothetical protein